MAEIEGAIVSEAIVRQFQSPAQQLQLNGISIFPRRGLKLTYYSLQFPPSLHGFTFSNQVLTPDIYGAN